MHTVLSGKLGAIGTTKEISSSSTGSEKVSLPPGWPSDQTSVVSLARHNMHDYYQVLLQEFQNESERCLTVENPGYKFKIEP